MPALGSGGPRQIHWGMPLGTASCWGGNLAFVRTDGSNYQRTVKGHIGPSYEANGWSAAQRALRNTERSEEQANGCRWERARGRSRGRCGSENGSLQGIGARGPNAGLDQGPSVECLCCGQGDERAQDERMGTCIGQEEGGWR
jgi:hypothetical protein